MPRTLAIIAIAGSLPVLAMTVIAANAEGTSTLRVKSGQPINVRYIFNCAGIGFEVWPHGQQHGTVKTERYTAERCLKKDVPHVRVIYQSNPGYRGPDELWIQSSGGYRHQIRLIVE